MVIKVSELAKELGITVEDVLEQLQRLYVDAEDGNSKVDEKIVGLVRIKLGLPAVAAKPPKPGKTKKDGTAAAEKPKKGKTAAKIKVEKAGKDAAVKKEAGAGEKAAEKIAAEVSVPKESGRKPKIPKMDKVVIISKREKVVEAEPEKAKEVEAKPEAVEKVLPAQTDKFSNVRPDFSEVDKAGKGRKVHKGVKYRPAIEVIETDELKHKFRKVYKEEKYWKNVKAAAAPEVKQPVAGRKTPQKVQMHVPANVRTIAPRINAKPNLIIQYLMGIGVVANINQDLDEDVIRDIMGHFGYELEIPDTIESMERELVSETGELGSGEEIHETKIGAVSRAPVVTFMGHVDHGKTSLLDYIRKTMVTKGEKGGITQHIGAYRVETASGAVTFLDTPGHAAFTAMRARGAHATDVVVLVVAADDGVMPQTKEAIDHARAAGVSIVVAINKCDLPGADPDKVRADLQKEGLIGEQWGGETMMAEVSAHTGEGVDHLVEMLMLESEMLELKAQPHLRARGVVIEGKKTNGQGIVATLLVQNGTLKPGDVVICGPYYGKVKAMINDKGHRIPEAGPSMPVEVLGLQGVPEAGEEFFIVKDEKKARTLTTLKQSEKRIKSMGRSQRVTLEDLHNRILEGSVKELHIILKADVQGSEEALKHSLEQLSTEEVKVKMIHSAVGNINESDVMLAMVSDAVVIGFHVKIDPKAEDLSKSEKVDIRLYDIIYEAIADVKAGMEGLLEPEEREVFQGLAQVREIFPSKNGKAAGCAILKGVIHRKDRVRVKRGQEVVYEGEIDSLKRFKDDVKDVREGFECGISVKGFNQINKNDTIEAFIIEKIARRLEK
ncbi:MAG: translation initiation factor IF-2 [Candidatus Omnitrophota bacterium]